MIVEKDHCHYGDEIKLEIYLDKTEIKQLKILRNILKKCDCRYSEDMDIIILPLLDAIIEKDIL
jgi:hypothetical protein